MGLTAARAVAVSEPAKFLRMECTERAGELIPAREVELAWGAIITTVRSRLLGIPAKVAARLAPAMSPVDAQAIWRREINEVPTELVRTVAYGEGDDKSAEVNNDASAEHRPGEAATGRPQGA